MINNALGGATCYSIVKINSYTDIRNILNDNIIYNYCAKLIKIIMQFEIQLYINNVS